MFSRFHDSPFGYANAILRHYEFPSDYPHNEIQAARSCDSLNMTLLQTGMHLYHVIHRGSTHEPVDMLRDFSL